MRDKMTSQPPNPKTAPPPTRQEGPLSQLKAPLPPPPHPPIPNGGLAKGYPPPAQAKAEARQGGRGGCKYKARGNIYVVFCNKRVWGMENGMEALAAGGPPHKRETWGRFPGDEELFGVPKAAVWQT